MTFYNDLHCQSCNSTNTRLIDHETLDLTLAPFDSELYGTAKCNTCNEQFSVRFNLSVAGDRGGEKRFDPKKCKTLADLTDKYHKWEQSTGLFGSMDELMLELSEQARTLTNKATFLGTCSERWNQLTKKEKF